MIKAQISDSFCTWEYEFSDKACNFSIHEMAEMIEKGTGSKITSCTCVEPRENSDYAFIRRILQYAEEYEKEKGDSPLGKITYANFVHWIFDKGWKK